jgi:hypothetical protein
MSTHVFNPKMGPILVEAEATGPTGSTNLKLVLDTGATTSLIRLACLARLGFDPNQPDGHLHMTTGSSVGIVPVFALTRFSALGQNQFNFAVIGHPLPSSAGVDGLLGLDFLRGQILTLDFRVGQITLA